MAKIKKKFVSKFSIIKKEYIFREMFIFVLATFCGSIFRIYNFYYNNKIPYMFSIIIEIICFVIMIVCTYCIFFRKNKPEISFTYEELIKKYKNDCTNFNINYNNKFIKLVGIIDSIQSIKDINNMDFIEISFKSNESISINGEIFIPSKNIYKYLNKQVNKEISFYGYLYIEGKVYLDIIYIEAFYG